MIKIMGKNDLSLKILMVDDDFSDAKLLERYLEEIEAGWSVDFHHLNRPEELEKKIKNVTYHIIFLDYKLGSCDGVQILKKMRKKGYERPIVLLTGRGDEMVAAEAFRNKANDYLPKKQLSPEQLETLIYNVLNDFFSRDVSQMNGEIKWVGEQDEITGLYNRRGLEKRIKEWRKNTDKNILCLLLIGLKGLEQVNESYGQKTGDKVLRSVAEIIEEETGEVAITGRLQGTDFSIALPDEGEARGRSLGKKIVKRIHREKESFVSNKILWIDASGTVNQLNKQDDVGNVIDEAVKKLYKAKEGFEGIQATL